MKEDQEILDLIERYHLGLLSEEEKNWVEQRKQSDISFAESLKVNEVVHEVVHGASIDMLRERMTADLAALDRRERNRKHWRIGSAIGIGFLFSLITWFYFIKDSSTVNKKIPKPEEKFNEPKKVDSVQQIPILSKPENRKNSRILLTDNDRKVKEDSVKPVNDQLQPSLPLPNDNKIPSKSEQEVQNSKEHEKVENTLNKIDCQLSFRTINHPTCKGESKGTIEIEKGSISGGKAPYIFYISNSEEKSSSGIFSDLKMGNYKITIEDLNGCRTSREVLVGEKNCASKKSYSFNPDFGEIWKVPFDNGEHGNFTIFNRQGLIIFKGTFGGSDLSEWNGTKADGSSADVGLYVCILEYSNGKTEKMEVSIIR